MTGVVKGDRSRVILLFVVIVDSFSYALIFPILPFFVLSHGAGAIDGGLLVTVHAICAVIGSPILGRLSDRFGRRAVLTLTLAGTGISYVLFAMSHTVFEVMLTRALAGLMAGNLGIVQAAIADTSSQKERGKAMGQVAGFWALGYVLGPAASAAVATAGSPFVGPGLFAAGIAMVAAVAVAFLLQVPAQEPGAIADVARATSRIGGAILVSLSAVVMVSICQNGVIAMTPFWAHHTLGWNQRDVSILITWAALGSVATQLVISPAVFKRLTSPQAFSASLISTVLGCGAIGLAQSTLGLVVGIPLIMSGLSLASTALNTTISQTAGATSQGSAMGSAVGASALGRIIGPSALALSYALLGPSSYFGWIAAIAAALCLSYPLSRLVPALRAREGRGGKGG